MAGGRTMRFGGSMIEPQVRTLGDLRDVLYDRDAVTEPSGTALYYMYRSLSLSRKDAQAMKAEDIRYDITVIPPRTLGREYVKTLGHYHPLVPGTGLSYPELYEVLEGKAHYLLQKLTDGKVTDVVVVEAGKGDKVLIPPLYGHITINPLRKELKMANLVSGTFSSVYEPMVEKRGGAYFELVDGFRGNELYGELPDLRKVKAKKILELGVKKSEEIYSLVRKDVKKLAFLNKPQQYAWLSDVY